jgi:hypothetical protein
MVLRLAHLRTLGVLAVTLLVAARADALTITQTHTISGWDYPGGSAPAIVGGTWQFNQFNPNLGTLKAVQFNFDLHCDVSIVEVNQLNLPLWVNLTALLDTSVILAPLVVDFLPQQSASGGQVTLQPRELATFKASFDQTYSRSFVLPNEVSAFYLGAGADDVRVNARVPGLVTYGGTFQTTSINLTLTYEYQVPDESSTLPLLAACVLGLFGAAHRFRINAA